MIKFFNSLTNKKEEFVVEGNVVNMYSCGPTVYYYAHIGNMRAYLFMDNIRRVLKYNGYEINGVMNYTDVGHMTSDEDYGDDKMEVASKRENKSPYEIAEFYTNFFNEQAKLLNIELPEHTVKATSVIKDIIEFVKGLLEKGYAYETSKGIYFDVDKFQSYGKLSGNPKDKMAGARIEVDTEKKNPYDFTLWIKAPKNHLMQWESPWGMGYPGWHIECSCMGKKFLGDRIDIHTGGIDHKSIHHENEIAQSDALEGKQVVKNWMHVEFLQVDGGKMGKSLGNLYLLKDLQEKGFSPLDYRYFYFMAHYSKQQNFTFEAMISAKNSYKTLKNLANEHKHSDLNTDNSLIEKYEQDFLNAINDDLNMPLALSVIWQMLKEPRSIDIYNTLMKFNKVLGFDFEEENQVPENIKILAEERWQAKQSKNYSLADSLRQDIFNKGYEIKDGKDGYTINKI